MICYSGQSNESIYWRSALSSQSANTETPVDYYNMNIMRILNVYVNIAFHES